MDVADHTFRIITILLFSAFFSFSVISYLRWQLPDKQKRLLEIMKKCKWTKSKREPAWIPYSLLVEVGDALEANTSKQEELLETARQAARKDYILPVIFASITAMLGSILLVYGPSFVDKSFSKVSIVMDGPFYFEKTDGQTDTKKITLDSVAKELGKITDEKVTKITDEKEEGSILNARETGRFTDLCKGVDNCKNKIRTLQNLQVSVFAFMGAFIWSLTYIMRRLYVIDLDSNAFYSVGVRIILSNFIAIIFFLAFEDKILTSFPGWIPAIAFFVGWFPRRVFQYMKEKVFYLIGMRAKEARSLPLEMIQGTQLFQRTRLSEAGIDDTENMANANLLELLIRTPFNPRLLIDWIAQAKLYLIFRDKIYTLREAKIRTIFDFVDVMRDDSSRAILIKLLEKIQKDKGAKKNKIKVIHEEELLTAWYTCKNDDELEWLRSARCCLLGLEGKERELKGSESEASP
ncbi:hypothetical protein [Sulfuriflexus mobilis]|uniref:hypothetical protein n=1 Tax=Sulfuriflexus mobilis TaxID=1811807 RepID=UPI000F84B60D|nr:hypothetical protein [Sulfuriflexus mobilis]